MKKTRKQPHELSLTELLQEVQHRANLETTSSAQQQDIIHAVINILQTYTRATEIPCPGRDMNEIRGQWHVKRALEVAAAGGHNILLIGPSGAGKAQLARTLPSLLTTTSPPPSLREPASSIAAQAFIGEPTTPGELTLAHSGVLLLKELDTFDPSLLTHLSQAVETQVISIPCQDSSLVLPAKFILIATVKPCPCGFFGDLGGPCLCSVQEIARYRQPLKEIVRTCFAIEIEVPLIGEDILRKRPEESSATIRQRVEAARAIQQMRYTDTPPLHINADLRSIDQIQHHCQMVYPGPDLLKSALQQLHLTPLELLRLQAVARTIADLDSSPIITGKHLAEAIRYLSGFIRDE